MQLRVSARLAFAAILAASSARAEDERTTKAATEIAGYTDSVGVSVFTPSVGVSVESPTRGYGVNGRYLVDVVSAASPDIVATASPRWSEVRHGGNLGVRYKPGTFGVGATGAASYTPDYLALSGGLQLVEELDEKNLTLVQGYTFGRDTIGRAGTPFATFSNELSYHVLSATLSRIVNPSLVVGASLDVMLERGDSSKPYRYVPMFAPQAVGTIPRGITAISVADARIAARPLEQLPLERNRVALAARAASRGAGHTLKLEQRLYRDDWALSASTTDLRWFFDAGDAVTLWPHLRVHVQSAVAFWQRAYASRGADDIPALRTTDRELGALTSLGLGAGARFVLGGLLGFREVALQLTADSTYTRFADTLYVKQRWSVLGTTTLEVTF